MRDSSIGALSRHESRTSMISLFLVTTGIVRSYGQLVVIEIDIARDEQEVAGNANIRHRQEGHDPGSHQSSWYQIPASHCRILVAQDRKRGKQQQVSE